MLKYSNSYIVILSLFYKFISKIYLKGLPATLFELKIIFNLLITCKINISRQNSLNGARKCYFNKIEQHQTIHGF